MSRMFCRCRDEEGTLRQPCPYPELGCRNDADRNLGESLASGDKGADTQDMETTTTQRPIIVSADPHGDLVLLQAWEPENGHAIVRTFPDTPGFWGTITSRPMPDGLDPLEPMAPHAIASRAARRAEAVKQILSTVPYAEESANIDGGKVWASAYDLDR